jgi:exodeoxyribonuclease V alpha subunit
MAESLLLITRRFLDQGGAPEVIGRSIDDYCPLLRVGDYLYHQRLYAVEGRLVETILTRLDHDPDHTPEVIAAARADVEARPAILPSGVPITLSTEQGSALELAASRSLAMISGGPGTGKTSIVVALLRVLVRLGIPIDAIELAAPTGKAAWRMGESIRRSLMLLSDPDPIERALITSPPTPQTLHRLLAFHPRTGLFRRHRNAPISAEVVIIDESSMIDIYLMERLLGALRPQTQLILLGDAHQLPSVSAGAVFKDLLNALSDARCTLTQSYRMREDDPDGRAILTFAQNIREGRPAFIDANAHIDDGSVINPALDQDSALRLCHQLEELKWRGCELLDWPQSEQWAFLDAWARRFILGDEYIQELRGRCWQFNEGQLISEEIADIEPLFLHQSQAKMLCVTQNLETGVAKVNARFHRRFSRFAQREATFLVGEPVMMLHNDYDRMLFNGDQGIILWGRWAEGSAQPLVVFPAMSGGYRAFEMEALTGRIEHCYAMTVHKSQGSEFDRVALLLPPRPLPLLTRELIYTAVTRSKSSVVVVGDPHLISPTSLRHHPRSSGVAERLVR